MRIFFFFSLAWAGTEVRYSGAADFGALLGLDFFPNVSKESGVYVELRLLGRGMGTHASFRRSTNMDLDGYCQVRVCADPWVLGTDCHAAGLIPVFLASPRVILVKVRVYESMAP